MTRTEALQKLLAVSPATYPELFRECGWRREDLNQELADGVSAGWLCKDKAAYHRPNIYSLKEKSHAKM